jgi:acetoin utilization deacetylase AcuC-like enzyme
MARTGFFFRQECLKHETGPGHPECPARLLAILKAFDRESISPELLETDPASRKDLLRIHTEEHVDLIENTCAKGWRYPDLDTVMCRQSWTAALLSAGGAITACKSVLDKRIDNAFVAMRPPGHHAEADGAMGFCLFNNVAIAARWMQQEAGIKRVAIIDWDVHHGNGTQHAFYEDDTVYYASMHQYPHYPGTGYPDERGKNNTNLNIQMPPGTPPEAWLEALEKKILPELAQFKPDFLLLSSGFDAHRLDPLGGQLLEEEHFAAMTRMVKPVADGRIVSLLEGGYHLEALGESSVAHVCALQE